MAGGEREEVEHFKDLLDTEMWTTSKGLDGCEEGVKLNGCQEELASVKEEARRRRWTVNFGDERGALARLRGS
uniref:Uncharacterized protein n=1 Tax=Steinernema glaseri TaxID=37863 RepID=A0A1I7YAW9_9BILA